MDVERSGQGLVVLQKDGFAIAAASFISSNPLRRTESDLKGLPFDFDHVTVEFAIAQSVFQTSADPLASGGEHDKRILRPTR
jgi:hypothetical protein